MQSLVELLRHRSRNSGSGAAASSQRTQMHQGSRGMSSTPQQQRPSYWPYAPPTSTPTSSPPPATQTAGATTTAATAARRTLSELIEHIRGMQGLKDIYEVAIKRNGMTTSLALLGGVLFADMLLYRPNNKRQAMLQTSLAASHTTSEPTRPISHNAPNSSSSSHSSGGSERSHDVSRLAAAHGVPAHA